MERVRVRVRKPKRKRRKIIKRLFTLMLLVIIAAAGYTYFEYKKGLSESDGDFKEDGQFEFNGEGSDLDEVNILVLGIDSRGEDHSRSDSMMVIHYNKKQKQPKLISIMRDSYVDIPGYDKQKVNAAYAYGGPELVRKTLKESFDLDINYYAIIDFKGFAKIVDAVAPDGIEVDVPKKMSYGIGMTLQPGKQILHGDRLLGYVRFRHDRESDFGRVRRQQEIFSELQKEAMSIGNIAQLPKLWGLVDPYIETNIPNGVIFSLGKDFLLGSVKETKSFRLPVDGSFTNKDDPTYGAVLDLDLEQNKEELKRFLNE
ncbi:LCP family protein [Bacillus paralicheniformis]|uniref:Regulatory protein MsrR n=2 Tax=Bacillus paralicheniformis TaxID=1648923 RepID=A0AAW6KGC6_9BACI|nr:MULTISPECIES: LCP family protein [Bacillus]ETB68849.1 transcriptional regulator [Bacillus sp. CPSM8]KJD53719.1 transcriptional regulator [Bacillus amyloliquefaciens]KUL13624.1 transcriptional regulator [Bacillus licheniformis LMG 7559]MBC8623032.1 LCP family protein [Robertmurraya crescens]MCD2368153.1 LCP family protein [Bacillus sp. BS3(2021)]POO77788.1 LytR family transcriptional regulator [Bacillus sp. MBGLi97]